MEWGAKQRTGLRQVSIRSAYITQQFFFMYICAMSIFTKSTIEHLSHCSHVPFLRLPLSQSDCVCVCECLSMRPVSLSIYFCPNVFYSYDSMPLLPCLVNDAIFVVVAGYFFALFAPHQTVRICLFCLEFMCRTYWRSVSYSSPFKM